MKFYNSCIFIDIFSQISDGAGQLVHWKLGEFLREVLSLPAAVYESPTFHYNEGIFKFIIHICQLVFYF